MSDLALQLIAENKKTRAIFLDLCNCGLTQIPAEIGELVWLESMSLADEWYEWDGQTWQKKKSGNSGDKNDGLIDIAPLAGLNRIRSLVVSATQVADLSPLAGLTALQTLNVWATQVADLSSLAGKMLILGEGAPARPVCCGVCTSRTSHCPRKRSPPKVSRYTGTSFR
jgi:internalin A